MLDPDKVLVKMDRGKSVSTLEVDIELPNGFDKQVRSRLPENQLA
jgi:cell division topological specificity factor